MSLRHVERVDVYAVSGEPPLSGAHWERAINPQQVKVYLTPAGETWSVVSVAVPGPYTESDDTPGTQRCHYYSGDRLPELPDYGEEAMTASLAALNTAA